MTSSASVFDQLIAPLSPAAFLEHWEKRPVFVPAAERAPAKLSLFPFDVGAFKNAAARIVEQPKNPEYGMPSLNCFQTDESGSRAHPVRADEIDATYAAGLSMTLTGLQLLDARMASFAARLQREIAYPGSINLQSFLSPAGHGAAMHFHPTSVISVQLEGAKRWRFSTRKAMDTPPDGVSPKGAEIFQQAYPWTSITLPDPAWIEERVLQPGDVLYIPAGTWHEASAVGHSLGIAIDFVRRPWHALIAERLQEVLIRRTGWRKTPPPLRFEDGRPGGLEALVDSCAEKLQELRTLVARMAPEDLAAWAYPDHLAIEEAAPTGGGLARTAPSSDVPDLRPDDVLIAPHPLTCSPATDDTGRYVLIVSSPYRRACIGIEALAMVDKLVQTPRFKAVDAMTWSADVAPFSWDETRSALEGLLAHRLLQRGDRIARPADQPEV